MLKMLKIILVALILLVIALISGLFWCFDGENLDFPVTEEGFPTGFIRISDEAQIYLGMHQDEI